MISHEKKKHKRETISRRNYDRGRLRRLAFLENTLTQAESLSHSLDQESDGIGINVYIYIYIIKDFICFK